MIYYFTYESTVTFCESHPGHWWQVHSDFNSSSYVESALEVATPRLTKSVCHPDPQLLRTGLC